MTGKQRAFTLIELMVVVTILLILVTAAAPSFFELLEKYRAKSVAEQLFSDLLYAKSESLKQRTAIHLEVRNSATGWCYGLHTAPDCDCYNTTACAITSLRQAPASAVGKVQVYDDGGDTLTFTPRNGLPSRAAVVNVADGLGRRFGVTINVVGLVGVCSNDFPGYPSCP